MYGADGLFRMSDQLWFSITMIKTVLIFAELIEWVETGAAPAVGAMAVDGALVCGVVGEGGC